MGPKILQTEAANSSSKTDVLRIVPFIRLGNLLAPIEGRPWPWTLEPRGRHAHLLSELWEAFVAEFPGPAEALGWYEPAGSHEEPGGGTTQAFRPTRQAGEFVAGGSRWLVTDPLELYRLAHGAAFSLRAVALAAIGPATHAVVSLGPGVAPQLHVGPDRIVRRGRDPLYDGLVEALDGFDARRLRLCPICARVFYADRRNKLACTAQCRDTNNSRRYRERAHVYEAKRAEREFAEGQAAAGLVEVKSSDGIGASNGQTGFSAT